MLTTLASEPLESSLLFDTITLYPAPCLEFTPARVIIQCLYIPLWLAQSPRNSPWLLLGLLSNSVISFPIFSFATLHVTICQRFPPAFTFFQLSYTHTQMHACTKSLQRVKVQENAKILWDQGIRPTTSSAFLWVNYTTYFLIVIKLEHYHQRFFKYSFIL